MRKNNRAKLYMGVSNMLLISNVAARKMSLFWFIVLVIVVLFIVGVVPCCKQYENIWLFVLTAIGGVPINISLTCLLIDIGAFETGFPVLGVLFTSIEIYLLLLGLEEIFMGLLGRIIWKKQRSMKEVV